MADKLTYRQLQKAVTDLQKAVARGSEAITVRAQHIDDEAKDTTRVAEMIGSMGVDTSTVAETQQLSRIMRGVSEAAITYASKADATARAAGAAYEQARTSHGGIHEAYTRAPVDVSNLDREWLRQE